MGPLPTSPRRDRRGEILVTAARLFAGAGFHGVSVDDLGAELGISGPAIYRYFPSKEAILAEMLLDISTRLLEGARERVTSGTPAEQLDRLIEFHARFARDEPDLIAVQFRDLGSVPERERRSVRALQRSYVDIWAQVLVEAFPGTPPTRARSSAQAAFGLLNSTPHSGRAGETDLAGLLGLMAAAALAAACTAE